MTGKFDSRWTFALLAATCAAIIYPCSATAQQNVLGPESNILDRFAHCRGLADAGARLACFDAAATALAAAGEVTLVSRTDVEQNQRQLFGFDVSLLNPFSERGESDELSSITSTMASARQIGPNGWLLTLEDGSVWRQIDTTRAAFSTRQPHVVTVRRAAMGSYMMKVGNTPAFRVKRE